MINPYEDTAQVLIYRIDSLVPTHPEILGMSTPWQLFKVEGFDCSDLQPSLAQAMWALSVVQRKHAPTS